MADDDEIMELEANRFAMELLMPREFLIKDVRELGGIDIENDPAIAKLAKRYQVSKQIMVLRIVQLFRESPALRS